MKRKKLTEVEEYNYLSSNPLHIKGTHWRGYVDISYDLMITDKSLDAILHLIKYTLYKFREEGFFVNKIYEENILGFDGSFYRIWYDLVKLKDPVYAITWFK